MLQQLLLLFHVLIALGLITLVLLQQGKGAEMGASFGSGASQTVFGSQGSGSFLFKLTGLFALLFFITSLSLGYLAGHRAKQGPIQNLAKLAQQLPPKLKEPILTQETQGDKKPIQTTKTSVS
jgi:preprotein translocase subunit SecG